MSKCAPALRLYKETSNFGRLTVIKCMPFIFSVSSLGRRVIFPFLLRYRNSESYTITRGRLVLYNQLSALPSIRRSR